MLALAVLWLLLAVAAATDIARHEIYNWTTYPGMLAGLLLNAGGFGPFPSGMDGAAESAVGFAACGLIMLTAFVFFDMGGGDVKLIAMVGAFVGLQRGIEALLWTFSLGFVLGIGIIIWQSGAWSLLRRSFEHARLVAKTRAWVPLTESERKPLKRGLFLAPSALAAITIVLWPEIAAWWTTLQGGL